MLAARRTLTHKYAGKIELPLLIPAFSSKGFGFQYTFDGKDERNDQNKREFSEVAHAIKEFTRWDMYSVLISAYDLEFDHLISPNESLEDLIDYLSKSTIVFIDSGGYELSSSFDSSEVKTFKYQPKEDFDKENYQQILEKVLDIKSDLHLIISNFDYESKGKPLEEQIQLANELFIKFPDCINDFILKPFTKGSTVLDPNKMSKSDFESLSHFDIIGVTENDLGLNLQDRIKRIAILRKGLNDAGLDTPIHIWGGLDPIITPLYFFVGADIFDGISWMRYGYNRGVAINKVSYSILKDGLGLRTSHQENEAFLALNNLRHLDNLSSSLLYWFDLEGKDFSMFEEVGPKLKSAYDEIKTNVLGRGN